MLLEISTTSAIPIYKQLRDQIVIGIAKKQLKPDDQLPSVRQLADELGINTMTISKAYNLLKDEGYLITDRRLGTKVAAIPKQTGAISDELATQLLLVLAEISIQTANQQTVVNYINDILEEFKKE